MWCPEKAAIVDARYMPEPFSTTHAVYIKDCEELMVGCRSSVVRALPAFFSSVLAFILTIVKIIHVHLVLRKTFITLVWKDQQSFYLYHFHINIFFMYMYVKFQTIASLFTLTLIYTL